MYDVHMLWRTHLVSCRQEKRVIIILIYVVAGKAGMLSGGCSCRLQVI